MIHGVRFFVVTGVPSGPETGVPRHYGTTSSFTYLLLTEFSKPPSTVHYPTCHLTLSGETVLLHRIPLP